MKVWVGISHMLGVLRCITQRQHPTQRRHSLGPSGPILCIQQLLPELMQRAPGWAGELPSSCFQHNNGNQLTIDVCQQMFLSWACWLSWANPRPVVSLSAEFALIFSQTALTSLSVTLLDDGIRYFQFQTRATENTTRNHMKHCRRFVFNGCCVRSHVNKQHTKRTGPSQSGLRHGDKRCCNKVWRHSMKLMVQQAINPPLWLAFCLFDNSRSILMLALEPPCWAWVYNTRVGDMRALSRI